MREKLLRDLKTVRADFDAWRQRRIGRERIPDALWAAAVGLLNHYPFGVVCRELRLSPRDLRKRRKDRPRVLAMREKGLGSGNPRQTAKVVQVEDLYQPKGIHPRVIGWKERAKGGPQTIRDDPFV